MDQATHNKIVSFIWGIADDVLRDLFNRDFIASIAPSVRPCSTTASSGDVRTVGT
jgi:hypothetical protein